MSYPSFIALHVFITSAWPKGLSHSFFDCSHENILGDSLESLRVAITETHEGRKGVASRSPVSDSTSVGDEKKGERKIQLGRRQSDPYRRRRPQLQATWHCHRRRPSPRRSHGSLTPRPQSHHKEEMKTTTSERERSGERIARASVTTCARHLS